MAIIDSLMKFLDKEIETITKFLSTPMGVYEFRDELIKNFRAFLMELIESNSPCEKKILRE